MRSEIHEVDMPQLLKKYKMLPPPSREVYASIPSPWKVAETLTKTPPSESEDARYLNKQFPFSFFNKIFKII